MKKESIIELSLPLIFQDRMVLQREKPVRIWGETNAALVNVTLSGKSGIIEQKSVQVCAGRFMCELPAQPAGTGFSLSVSTADESGGDPAKILLQDISFGDIWLACGQSNMEYFLRYDAHWNDIKKEPVNPDIHMYNVPQIAYEGQQRDLPDSGRWFVAGDPAWAVFSAPGYCFAQVIQPETGVPTGVIGCNWGGTSAVAWMREEDLNKEPFNVYLKEYEDAIKDIDPDVLREESMKGWAFEESYSHALEWRTMMYGLTREEQIEWMEHHAQDPVLPLGPYHHYRPSGLYHTMLETIAPLSVKGVLWYQGESDNAHADIYDQLMAALVRCFRETFEDEDLPFLYVQLAPYQQWLDDTGENYPAMRLVQDRASHLIDNAYMTSIMDLGDRYDIHPKFKREVGQRLALLALGKVYGRDILCEALEISDAAWDADGQSIRISLHHAEGGLTLGNGVTELFAISQAGRALTVSAVRADGESLVVTLEKTAPTEGKVRIEFAMEPYCEVQIWNQAGLPLKSFVYEF
ncbi:MAG: hypothetical protein IKE03_08795 [Blautia sp.]|nr:hypothetical protein [Blautia sp.]